MKAPRIFLTDNPGEGVRAAIEDPLVRVSNEKAGSPYDPRPLVITIADPESGEVLGGLWGRTARRYLSIELVYVPDAWRGAGLGHRLVEMAEDEARRRGCVGVWLDSYSFQAPEFYERLGYEEFGVLDDYPPGHRRHFFRKRL